MGAFLIISMAIGSGIEITNILDVFAIYLNCEALGIYKVNGEIW